MSRFILIFSLSAILFSSSTFSLLKQKRNVLRPSISRSIDLSADSIDLLQDGWRWIELDYIFNGHYRISSYYGIDTERVGGSFYYYKIFNNSFINAGFDVYESSWNSKFYYDVWLGSGLSKSLKTNLNLSGEIYYIVELPHHPTYQRPGKLPGVRCPHRLGSRCAALLPSPGRSNRLPVDCANLSTPAS